MLVFLECVFATPLDLYMVRKGVILYRSSEGGVCAFHTRGEHGSSNFMRDNNSQCTALDEVRVSSKTSIRYLWGKHSDQVIR